MAFLPKVNFRDIDLAEYGGEGKLRVRGQTAGISSAIANKVMEMAKKDGINISAIRPKDLESLYTLYAAECSVLLIEKCTSIEEDGKFRPLTKEEVENLPQDLFMDIRGLIDGMDSFPLEPTAGEEAKKERSKHTAVQ